MSDKNQALYVQLEELRSMPEPTTAKPRAKARVKEKSVDYVALVEAKNDSQEARGYGRPYAFVGLLDHKGKTLVVVEREGRVRKAVYEARKSSTGNLWLFHVGRVTTDGTLVLKA